MESGQVTTTPQDHVPMNFGTDMAGGLRFDCPHKITLEKSRFQCAALATQRAG